MPFATRPLSILLLTFVLAGAVEAVQLPGPNAMPKTSGSSGRAVWADDFNRASGTNMGPDWVEVQGDMSISSNKGVGANSVWSVMLYDEIRLNHETARLVLDLDTPVANGHVGLIMGASSGSQDWIYTRFADTNGDARYDQVFFSRQGSNTGWGIPIRTIATPSSQMRVSVFVSGNGNQLTVELDTDFNGTFELTFTNNGLNNLPFNPGVEFGIATQGACDFDNWTLVGPDGPTMAVESLVGGGIATASFSNVTPNHLVHLMWSPTGGGPTPSEFGPLSLSQPITVFHPVLSRPDGTAWMWFQVPAAARGRRVWFHGLDYGSGKLSNPYDDTVD